MPADDARSSRRSPRNEENFLEQLSDLRKQFLGSLDSIKKSIKALETTCTTVTASLEAISGKLNSIEDTLTERITALETNINIVSRQQVDEERRRRLTDITLSGIPKLHRENLQEVYSKIVKKIGHTPSLYTDVFRIPSRQSSIKQPPPVIIRFSTVTEKMEFYRKCKQLSLTAADIGFSQPECAQQKLYFNHSLTKMHRELFLKARRIKSAGKITSCFIINGFVYIKRTLDPSAEKITALSQLD